MDLHVNFNIQHVHPGELVNTGEKKSAAESGKEPSVV